ncbi:enoyl-CoA hydratase/isomerase family protein [Parapedobacter sp. ISTM3]|uniref:Methylglutaconyl-CoA hydratase n=1 Tax=Parapedobacter luteus TaxID=623280 RepID=A0A1T5AYH9_9SPHI|nr:MULTISPECIES: enoyl-CoA hydratase/isomerase family protein [Parapedobacter]MBK1440375.1 enoyl-CoA hydratase/isomerase family protein [Parapedobacter sp. ISTM3]SKB40068.1 methylglutaconyl-CoA hydratase [Parapedobacter luteus]
MDSGFVKTAIDTSGLAIITFGHPVHNALPSNLLTQLREHIETASASMATKLILLQSSGEGAFCAGASFDELLTLADEQAGTAFFSRVADVINAIRKSTKLVIGRVQGKAVGGGVGLIASCDYCFASEKAAVKLSEISIHLGPFVIAPALARKIGVSALTALSLNPTVFFDAQWALQHGLFHTVMPSVDDLDDKVHGFCMSLLNTNQEALLALKKTLWRGTEDWDELLYEQAAISGRLAVGAEIKQQLNSIKKSK